MATPITISIPHQLGRAEARRRIETGFAKIIHLLPGSAGTCSERWDGDRLIFSAGPWARPSPASSTSRHRGNDGDRVAGVLGMIAGGLKDRLQKVGQLLLTKK